MLIPFRHTIHLLNRIVKLIKMFYRSKLRGNIGKNTIRSADFFPGILCFAAFFDFWTVFCLLFC